MKDHIIKYPELSIIEPRSHTIGDTNFRMRIFPFSFLACFSLGILRDLCSQIDLNHLKFAIIWKFHIFYSNEAVANDSTQSTCCGSYASLKHWKNAEEILPTVHSNSWSASRSLRVSYGVFWCLCVSTVVLFSLHSQLGCGSVFLSPQEWPGWKDWWHTSPSTWVQSGYAGHWTFISTVYIFHISVTASTVYSFSFRLRNADIQQADLVS